MPESEMHLVHENQVKDCKVAYDELKDKIERYSTWFGIVDGAHRCEALQRAARDHPDRFGGLPWTALVLQRRSLSELRAFAKNRNEKQDQKYVVTPTLYDALHSMQEEIITLRKRTPNKTPSIASIISPYAFGEESKPVKGASATTLRTLAKAAMEMSTSVVEVIGDILNAEEPDAAASRAPPNVDKRF